MACRSRKRIQKRIAIRRKLHILRTLTNSTSVEASSIIKDAFLYISALKLKLEILKRENMVMKHINQLPLLEVKVDKLENNGFRLKVTNEKRRDDLVYILQAFEEMGIVVIEAKVSCNGHFVMEAIVEANHGIDNVDHQAVDPSVLTEVILKAIEKSGSN